MVKIVYNKVSGHSRHLKNHPIAKDPNIVFSYKNISLLNNYVSEGGKILSSRVNLINKKTQKKLAHAIKLRRFLAL